MTTLYSGQAGIGSVAAAAFIAYERVAKNVA